MWSLGCKGFTKSDTRALCSLHTHLGFLPLLILRVLFVAIVSRCLVSVHVTAKFAQPRWHRSHSITYVGWEEPGKTKEKNRCIRVLLQVLSLSERKSPAWSDKQAAQPPGSFFPQQNTLLIRTFLRLLSFPSFLEPSPLVAVPLSAWKWTGHTCVVLKGSQNVKCTQSFPRL